ncbi:MAG: type I DNA topoisomerase [Lachnospiraceae bacterium]|nr:type I DNA topoisomerase [Candidatus Colinaster scatohippi]
MAKYLVIVESPTKVKTVGKFLGANYKVMASQGHVRDLPKSSLGIDVDGDFEPHYITIRGKGDILSALRKEVKKAEKIYLATDPDREGEAISWHLIAALKLEDKQVYRITFNEITKNAVKESLKNAREIDMNLVDAQQARRCLDRVVGYQISPVLWAKVKRGLSAGRVQSVALRIVCDREEEINNFIPEEYWTIDAELGVEGSKKTITAKYSLADGETLSDKKAVDMLMKDITGRDMKIADVKHGERTKKMPLPFTTSTLQQEASKALNFSTQKTMRVAQQLYEGVEIKGQGTVGLISYLRTDSTRISDEAEEMVYNYINSQYGEKYVAAKDTLPKSNKKIQDAHEAIRPTDVNRTPALVKDDLTKEQFRLYQLIWKRFVASRMAVATYDTVSAKFDCNGHKFTASSSKLKFDGFMSVYVSADEVKEENNALLNTLTGDTRIIVNEIQPTQHFTQPAPHYTEASLVHAMEELGIGRPSTYATTITTILGRRYIVKEGKNIFVTEIGDIVNSIMKDAFPQIVDVDFTATMETLLDGVEEGTVKWKTIIENFYPDLKVAVDAAEAAIEKIEINEEQSGELCEECGRPMNIKYGPHGRFQACSGFPDCRNTKPYYEKIDVACPKCGQDIVIKATRKGRRYYGCIDNPNCDFMVWQRPSGKNCPKCNKSLLVKGNKLVCMDEECGYSEDVKK